ncbi:MAG: hypothetical protein LBM69_06450 [Lachnospiraceae bacterium]|jgi:uncharacterized membrane protein|nr:hypothetical protein [Lachnospiraceae bacterium]
MDKKATAIVGYLTIIGWIIAYFVGDRKAAKFHLNQGLVLGLAGVVMNVLWVVPFFGGLLFKLISLFIVVCVIIGIYWAFNDQDKELPIVGAIHLLQ